MKPCNACHASHDAAAACPTGAPVQTLSPRDPLNQALGAFVLAFNEVHSTILAFIEEELRGALERRLTGWLDLKLSIAGGKLIVRRRLRERDGTAPGVGRWWTLPVSPTVLAELFERSKPAPPEEAVSPAAEVDMAVAGAPAPPELRAADQLRARAREAAALATNLRRTFDQLRANGVALGDEEPVELDATVVAGVGHGLERAAAALEEGVLQ